MMSDQKTKSNVMIHVKRISPSALNPTEFEQCKAKVADIVAAFGTDEAEIDWSECPAIVVDEDLNIFDGHHRYAAFLQCGFESCRVIVINGFAGMVADRGLEAAYNALEIDDAATWAAVNG